MYKDRGVEVVAVAVVWWLVVLLCRVDLGKGRRDGDCNKGIVQPCSVVGLVTGG